MRSLGRWIVRHAIGIAAAGGTLLSGVYAALRHQTALALIIWGVVVLALILRDIVIRALNAFVDLLRDGVIRPSWLQPRNPSSRRSISQRDGQAPKPEVHGNRRTARKT